MGVVEGTRKGGRVCGRGEVGRGGRKAGGGREKEERWEGRGEMWCTVNTNREHRECGTGRYGCISNVHFVVDDEGSPGEGLSSMTLELLI